MLEARALALVRYINTGIWAIDPDRLLAFLDAKLREDAVKMVRPAPVKTGSIGVITIGGFIDQRPAYWTDTSTEETGQVFDGMMADPGIKAIVLEIDSPGGSVAGVSELGGKFAAAKGQKKVVAVASSMAASAAYWLGSQAQEFYVTPSGEVGSIGVWTMHIDESKMLERWGIKVTLISAGKFKVEGNPFEPFTEEAKAYVQSQIGAYYDQFVKAVAQGRGVSQKKVREGFGEGRMLMAEPALAEQMVDGVASLEEVLTRLGVKLGTAGASRALLERRQALIEDTLDAGAA